MDYRNTSQVWINDFLPAVIPYGWTIERSPVKDSVCFYNEAWGCIVIISGATELDGKRWIHLSASKKRSIPSWEDLKDIKDIFIGRERTALQVLPPTSKYINHMPYCLHLFHCIDGDVTPDFTRGMGSL